MSIENDSSKVKLQQWVPVTVGLVVLFIQVWTAFYSQGYFKEYYDFVFRGGINQTIQKQLEPKLLSKEQLSYYSYTKQNETLFPYLMIGILGEVYDVSQSTKFYGKDGKYKNLTGVDASKAYVSGNFADDLNDDVAHFDIEGLSSLFSWRQFYRDHKDYEFAGYLRGAFYDENMQPTELLRKIELSESLQKEKDDEISKALRDYPTCQQKIVNDRREGWCFEQQGFPRRTRILKRDGTHYYRCSCQISNKYSQAFQLYEDCDVNSRICFIDS